MTKRKLTATELAAIQFRWGQLIAGIEAARSALALAVRGGDLLSDGDREALADVAGCLSEIEQRAWSSKYHG